MYRCDEGGSSEIIVPIFLLQKWIMVGKIFPTALFSYLNSIWPIKSIFGANLYVQKLVVKTPSAWGTDSQTPNAMFGEEETCSFRDWIGEHRTLWNGCSGRQSWHMNRLKLRLRMPSRGSSRDSAISVNLDKELQRQELSAEHWEFDFTMSRNWSIPHGNNFFGWTYNYSHPDSASAVAPSLISDTGTAAQFISLRRLIGTLVFLFPKSIYFGPQTGMVANISNRCFALDCI